MRTASLISVVVPAYNAEKSIAGCLTALLEQKPVGVNYEIIVVNDGSVDRTAAVATQLNVRVLSQPHQGPAVARNTGAAAAQGEILLFIDADCTATPEWLQEMVLPFNEREVAGVKGAYRTLQRSIAARFAQIEFEERYRRLQQRPCIDFVDTYSAGFRREAFEAAGGFDPGFPVANHEDVDLSYRLDHLGYQLRFNPKAIVYHSHPDTIGKYLRVKFWRGYWRLVVYRRFPRKAAADSYTPQTLKAQVLLVYLIGIGLLFGGIDARWLWVPLSLIGVGCVTMGSFLQAAVRKDIVVGCLSPALLWLRAMAIAAGMAWAIIGLLLRKPMFRMRGLRTDER